MSASPSEPPSLLPRSETPVLPRRTHSHTSGYDTNVTELGRNALFSDYPSVATVDIGPLLDEILPLMSEDILGRVASAMPRSAKATVSPRTDAKYEDDVFGILMPELFDRVVSGLKVVKGSDFKPSVMLYANGKKAPMSDVHSTSRPDGGLALMDHLWTDSERSAPEFNREGVRDYMQISSPLEFKKAGGVMNERDNLRKVLWSLHHLLRNDPRRKSALGLTVANESVRVAYLDRSNVVVSEAFSIHSEWLVRIFATLATATREQLGFDDTVAFVMFKTVDKKTIRVWDYEVQPPTGPSRHFRTQRRMADRGADILTGRGNRVWEVKEVVDGEVVDSPTLALKDAWPEASRQTEVEIVNRIKGLLRDDDPRAKHFLQIECAGPVRRSDRTADVTSAAVCALKRNGYTSLHAPVIVRPNLELTSGNSSMSLPDKSVHGELPTPGFHRGTSSPHRQHHRMVFEFGQDVSHMSSYKAIFHAIHGALCALSAVHDARYIHRDISPSNIVVVKRAGAPSCRCAHDGCQPCFEGGKELVAVLIDFEFALETSSNDPHHAARTGTLDFMSCDVLNKMWDRSLLPPDRTPLFPRTVPFRQNTFDDVQSFLWMLVWIAFRSFLGGSLCAASPQLLKARSAFDLFYNQIESQITLSWRYAPEFQELLENILYDDHLATLIPHLVKLRADLRHHQAAGLNAAYSTEARAVDVETLSQHTPPAIESSMDATRKLLQATAADTALAGATFDLFRLAS